jgi:hypothetical protein
VPWPTAVPAPPPYPTLEPKPWQGGSDQQNTLFLPSNVLTIDLATHPTESWAAVGAVVWSGTDDPERAFVSVYHPLSRRWSAAHQVDLGAAQLGRFARTIAVGITGDRQVQAVWGMSDPDFADNDPPAGIWASASADYGASWAPPQRIASDCRQVDDLATSTEGDVVVMLICNDGPNASTLAIVTRRPDGSWLPLDRLNIPVWYYSAGSVVITGSGADARAVGLVFAEQGGHPVGYLVSRRLADSGPWQIAKVDAAPADGQMTGLRMWYVRGLAFTRQSGQQGLIFSWTDTERSGAYAVTSLDGGRSWGPVETIIPGSGKLNDVVFVAPAYDPVADRLVAVWACCGFTQFSTGNSTHYASWSVPGSGTWRPEPDAPPIPLVLGSRSAFETVSAQASNSRTAWVAWVERQQRIEIRTLDLNQVIPVDQYPQPSPMAAGGGQ